jgi:DNA polymerase-3 subunit beta
LAQAAGEVDAGLLRRALARVLPVVHPGNEAGLENLTGVKLDGTADGLTLVGTDRWRVGVARIDWKPTDESALDALVPADLLEAASRATGAGTVRLFCGDSTFGLEGDGYRVVGRQIATRYPDISRFMPSPGEHYAVIDVPDLARAVDEAMVMLDKEPAVRLSFEHDTHGTPSVEVAATGEGRHAEANSQVHALHGAPVAVAVNAGYLRTALRLIESEAAALHFTSRAVLALPSDADGAVVEGYQHLVMRTKA